MDALSLYDLNALVRRSLEQCLPDEYWVQAELSEVRTHPATGHCYVEFVQKDPRGNNFVAKARGVIWSNVFRLLRPYFEESTGQAFEAGIKVLVQVSVNGYGAAAMAGFAAYMKVDGFNILPVLSFSMAATTFVGQNFGAGKIDRVKKGTFVTLGMCIVYTILTGILLLVFQDSIMHLFTGDETVIAYGKICMLYFCPFYWMLGILQGLAGTVRGTGKSVPPMVVLLISLCLFRIVWIQFALPLFAGIEGVLLVYPVSWAVGAVLMVLYAWKGKWMQLPEAIS